MLQKLSQGTGRLIRAEQDKGVISILDPRSIKVTDTLKEVLPFVKYTTSLEEVYKFCQEKEINKGKSK